MNRNSRSIHVGVDGKCLVPPRAGVARYLEGVLAGVEELGESGVAIELIAPRRPRRTLPWVLWDLQRATSRGFDLFHFPFYYPPLAPRCPVTVAVYDLLVVQHPEWFSPRYFNTLRGMIPAGIRRADAVVTSSEAVAEEICCRFRVPRSRVRAIPLGVDRQTFAPPGEEDVHEVLTELEVCPPYCLQVGALEPRRGVDLAVGAVAQLREKVPDLELVLVGDTRRRVECLQHAPPWVRRLGWVADEKLPSLFSAAAAVVAPSRGEGFDLPVLEALACGAVVVASDIPVHVEHFAPAVELFPSGDAEALASALERVIHDTARASALRAAGRRHAAGFTWRAAARSHLELWREIAG